MKTKLLSLTLGLSSIYALLLAPSAGAVESVSLDVTLHNGIAWVEAEATGPVPAFEVRIMAPTSGGTRSLWQRCRFSESSAGTYRCGIDAAEGSPAQKRKGTWVATVFSGGVRVARAKFTL